MEEIDDIQRGRLWRIIFLHNAKSSSFGGTQKLYWRRVLGGLHEFFKFYLCSYNILRIKNILIISVNLSFSKKITLSKNMNDFTIFSYISNPPKSSPPLQSLPLPSKLPYKAFCSFKVMIWSLRGVERIQIGGFDFLYYFFCYCGGMISCSS